MTVIEIASETCIICGTASLHDNLLSVTEAGACDLDMRPPKAPRLVLPVWIRRCPSCGYCAKKLSEESKNAAEIVKSAVYRERLDAPSFPALANDFLCSAMLLEASKEFARAGWAAVRAAWVCDDRRKNSKIRYMQRTKRQAEDIRFDDKSMKAAAIQCRNRAIELFLRAQEHGISFLKGNSVEEAMLADLFRRSGRFRVAREICQRGLEKKTEDHVRELLQFQIRLAQKRDMKCYRMDIMVDAVFSGFLPGVKKNS